MKKILFATTALVASAGIASAQGVEVTGFAEFGIFKNENGTGDGFSGDNTKTQVFTDIDVTFSMTGEADNGLTFGASFDLDELDGDGDTSDAARLPDATMFLSFAGATLTVGDTDSAFDARLTEVAIGGAINDDHTVHPGYNGNSMLDEAHGGQELRLDYSFDAFTVSVSTSPDRFDTFDPSYAIGVSYDANLGGVDMGFGLGYIEVDDLATNWDQLIGLSVDASFANGLQAIFNYTDITDRTDDLTPDGHHMAIGLGYTMNALTLGANYGVYDYEDDTEATGYGLTANYDMGGGLEAQLGYGGGDPRAGDYEDTYSLGLAMSF